MSTPLVRTLSRAGAAAALSLLGAASAFAQSQISLDAPAGSVGAGSDIEIKDIISFAATYLVSISGGIAVLFLVIGGIQYMTAGGSDDKVQGAKKVMRNAVVGLVIVLLAFIIISNTLKLSYKLGDSKAPAGGGAATTVSGAGTASVPAIAGSTAVYNFVCAPSCAAAGLTVSSSNPAEVTVGPIVPGVPPTLGSVTLTRVMAHTVGTAIPTINFTSTPAFSVQVQ